MGKESSREGSRALWLGSPDDNLRERTEILREPTTVAKSPGDQHERSEPSPWEGRHQPSSAVV
jgi:hypothetical protein